MHLHADTTFKKGYNYKSMLLTLYYQPYTMGSMDIYTTPEKTAVDI
jgi:hypothetical protein